MWMLVNVELPTGEGDEEHHREDGRAWPEHLAEKDAQAVGIGHQRPPRRIRGAHHEPGKHKPEDGGEESRQTFHVLRFTLYTPA
jgi:hypothetical protein